MSLSLSDDQITVVDFTANLLDRGWSLQRAGRVLMTLSRIHLLRPFSAVEVEVLDDLSDAYGSVCWFPTLDGDRLVEIGFGSGDRIFEFHQSALTDQLICWCTY